LDDVHISVVIACTFNCDMLVISSDLTFA